MRPRDLAGRELVVIADVRLRIAPPVLELDPEADPELLDVKPGAVPVDPDPLADLSSHLSGEVRLLFAHRNSLADRPPATLKRPVSLAACFGVLSYDLEQAVHEHVSPEPTPSVQ